MKKNLNITAVFLATVFLLSSLGFSVSKMVCLKSGKTKVSLANIHDCCKKTKSPLAVVKANCCDINTTSFNLGDIQTLEKGSLQFLQHHTFYQHQFLYISRFSGVSVSKLFFADLPPPLHGKDLLSFISSYLI